MKKMLLLAALLLTAATTLRAREYTVTSPDRRIVVTVATDPVLTWRVERDGERLIDASRIALKLTGEEPFGERCAVRRVTRRAVDQRMTAEVPTKFREVRDRCNELLISFRGDWAVRLRVYDNGAAYRFETSRKGNVEIERECAEFRFAEGSETLWPRETTPDFVSHCEASFVREPVTEADSVRYAFLPVWFTSPGGTRMVVTETDLEDYPCMFLRAEGGVPCAAFPPVVLESRLKEGSDRNEEFVRTAPFIARTQGTRTFP